MWRKKLWKNSCNFVHWSLKLSSIEVGLLAGDEKKKIQSASNLGSQVTGGLGTLGGEKNGGLDQWYNNYNGVDLMGSGVTIVIWIRGERTQHGWRRGRYSTWTREGTVNRVWLSSRLHRGCYMNVHEFIISRIIMGRKSVQAPTQTFQCSISKF